MGEGDHYRTLGLRRDASKADIKNAFFRLAHRYHPDHHPHADAAARAETALRFRQAKDAYEVLSDDRRRAEYDFRLRSSSSSSSGYRQRYGQGGSTSSSSSSASSGCGHRHGHGAGSGSRPPPPPRGGSKLYVAFLCALFVLCTIGEIAQELENWEREREQRIREWEEMKRDWEKMKREWENNPWKSWMESKEKKKNEASKKNWWTDFFRS